MNEGSFDSGGEYLETIPKKDPENILDEYRQLKPKKIDSDEMTKQVYQYELARKKGMVK